MHKIPHCEYDQHCDQYNIITINNETISSLIDEDIIKLKNKILTIKEEVNIIYIDNLDINYIICNDNDNTDLVVSNCNNLLKIKCCNNNLGNLELENVNNLKYLKCNTNTDLEYFILGNAILSLEYLSCSNCDIKNDMDFNELINLKYLNVSYNKIKNLNLNDLVNLEELNCSCNRIEELKINSNKLRNLNCNWNELNSLDINNLTSLLHLECQGNNFKTLSFNLDNLLYLDIKNNNKLEEINLNCKMLKTFKCNPKKIININLINNLQFLNIFNDNMDKIIIKVEKDNKFIDEYKKKNYKIEYLN